MKSVKMITTHLSRTLQASLGTVEGEQYCFIDIAANISAFSFLIAYRISPKEYQDALHKPGAGTALYNACAQGKRENRVLGPVKDPRAMSPVDADIDPEWIEYHRVEERRLA